MKVSRCARWGCVSITSWNTEIWKSFRPQLPFCLLLCLHPSFTILLAILCLAKWLTSILNEWARTAWEVAAVEQGRGAGAAGWVVAWRGWACQTGGLPVMGNGIRRTCVLNATSRYNNNNCWSQPGRGMRTTTTTTRATTAGNNKLATLAHTMRISNFWQMFKSEVNKAKAIYNSVAQRWLNIAKCRSVFQY